MYLQPVAMGGLLWAGARRSIKFRSDDGADCARALDLVCEAPAALK